jgi:hypothetical protein
VIAMLLVAPTCPGVIEHFTLDALVRIYYAPISNEGTNWTGEVRQFLYRLVCRGWLNKVSTRGQAVTPCNRPKQNT